MHRRWLGSSELEVSVIALGTWAMAGEAEAWGQVDDNESIATIERALDLGINLIDTAASYGRGHAEEIVGKAVRERRDQVLIATRCDPRSAQGPIPVAGRRLTRERVTRECEASLRRLQTDYIDLYLLHAPDPETPIAESFDALSRLREEGKVRAIGLSNYGCEEVAAALQAGPVHAIETPFSLLQRRAAEDLLPFCVRHGIGALAYGALAKGLLTGKFTPDSRIQGIRAADSEFLGPRFRKNLARVAKLSAIAARSRRTVAQLALQWVLRHPGVASVIVGAKRPSQIEQDIGGDGWELSSEELAEIDGLLAES